MVNPELRSTQIQIHIKKKTVHMCKYIHSDVQIQGQPLFPVILESTMHE